MFAAVCVHVGVPFGDGLCRVVCCAADGACLPFRPFSSSAKWAGTCGPQLPLSVCFFLSFSYLGTLPALPAYLGKVGTRQTGMLAACECINLALPRRTPTLLPQLYFPLPCLASPPSIASYRSSVAAPRLRNGASGG